MQPAAVCPVAKGSRRVNSVLLKKVLGLDNLRVYRKNFLREDLARASVVVCYLFPGDMRGIENKLKAEGGSFEYLISNNLSLPSNKPIKTIQIDDFYKSPIYLYEL